MPDALIFGVEPTSAVFRIEFKPGDDELAVDESSANGSTESDRRDLNRGGSGCPSPTGVAGGLLSGCNSAMGRSIDSEMAWSTGGHRRELRSGYGRGCSMVGRSETEALPWPTVQLRGPSPHGASSPWRTEREHDCRLGSEDHESV